VADFLQSLIAGPVLPATILLSALLLWSVLTISIGVGFDLDAHAHGFLDSLGHITWDGIGSVMMFPMRWLNMRDIPLILWLAVFSLIWWNVSIVLYLFVDRTWFGAPGWLLSSLLIGRNLAIALPITKLFTQPMRGWISTSHFESKYLIGQEAEISSYEATTEHGQVKFKTDAAPLLLNVRTDGPHLEKGTRVWITHYDPKRRIYIVSATTTSLHSSDE
jgi:Protein of unknown function (DUF1449)